MKRQHTSEQPQRQPVVALARNRMAWARLWRATKQWRRRMVEADDADLAQRVRLSGEW
ncbi:MAG: hypothetical protein AB7I35_03000 [Ramlibacter sp.]